MKLLQQLHFGASQQLHFGASQFLIFLQLLNQLLNFATGAGLSKAMVVAERERLKGVDVD